MIKAPIPLYVHVPYAMLSSRMELIRSLNLNPEIYLSAQVLDRYSLSQFQASAAGIRAEGLTVTVHAPFMDLAPGSPDSQILSVTRKRLASALTIAELFAAKTMVCHPGYDPWSMDGAQEEWLQTASETFRDLAAAAEKAGIVLALENIFERNPRSLVALLDAVKHPHFRACFDCGHFNIFAVTPLEDWLTAVGPYLAELHLHDNIRDRDEHWPPGRGSFPFARLIAWLEAASIKPVFTMEIHKEDAVIAARDQVRKMLIAKN